MFGTFRSGNDLCRKVASTVGCQFINVQRFPSVVTIPFRNYAARKGTREKAKKKKVKVEVKKAEFIPHNLREKALSKGPLKSRRLIDDSKQTPVDDVWISRFCKWPVHSFEEAVNCHRETHHPDIYNLPDAPLTAFIELDMRTAKKTKFVESFSRIAKIPHPFSQGEDRSILVFCKTPELKEEAQLAGATLVGDVDILKKVEKGDIVLPDFHFILAHPNILPELVGLRGLLKKKFPSPKLGTLGADIGDMVRSFKTGIQYWALRDEFEQDYGFVEASLGPLNMEAKNLEENFKALIDDVLSQKPKKPEPFITRVLLKSPPSVERLKINLDTYLVLEEEEEGSDSDEENRKTVA